MTIDEVKAVLADAENRLDVFGENESDKQLVALANAHLDLHDKFHGTAVKLDQLGGNCENESDKQLHEWHAISRDPVSALWQCEHCGETMRKPNDADVGKNAW